MIQDDQFILQFENQSLDPAYFNHLGHLRLAWLYLKRYDFNTVLNKICTGIQQYAESLGAVEKFHYTISYAFIKIMEIRIEKLKEKTWEKFVQENSDLIESAQTVLYQYYSTEALNSSEAKKRLVEPNLKPF